jgi:NADPH:quinone reductase-like Zn-dependent oxidoreductase
VRFDQYGGLDVLEVREVDAPRAGEGQIVVAMRFAGINPGEVSIREGYFSEMFPATFPCGEGSDLAGVVEAVGPGVSNFAVGDEVIAFTNERASHADLVLIEAANAIPRPAGVPWEQAGALFIAGTSAFAAVRSVAIKEGDVLVVSGAAGGVGSLIIQLAKRAGATVVGLASERNHDWLREHGAIPITYGDGVVERITEAAGPKVDAFIDTFGGGYVDLAIEQLGVPPERINTLIDFEAAARIPGVSTEANMDAASADVVESLAAMIAGGELEIPIAATYPLAEVHDAYRDLERRHTHGKIVLVP